MGQHPEISIVVPMFNEQEVLDIFFEKVTPIISKITNAYEIICVNDGSTDKTFELLQAYCEKDAKIKAINLSRNFGKEYALTAGIDCSTGHAVIPIDADLQDPPEVLTELVEKWRQGYEMVLAVRNDRSSDSFFKRLSAGAFYQFIGKIGDVHIPNNAGDFRLMDRKVVQAFQGFPERSRFTKGIFASLGFKQTTVYYCRACRAAGESKWKYWRLWNFAIEGITSFTTVPLKIWSYTGFTLSMLGLAYMFYVIFKTLIMGVDVPGYASLIVIMLFFSGLNMMGLGVLGEYISRIFVEVKQRPIYIVSELVNFSDEDIEVAASLSGRHFSRSTRKKKHPQTRDTAE